MNSRIKLVTACLITAVVVAVGCSKKHGDAPAPLNVTVPPNVTNLTVTNPQSFDYDVSWSVGDPSNVQYYRLYASFDGSTFTLQVDTIPASPVQVQSFAPVAAFGVSVVGLDNVEGAMVTEDVP